VAETKAKCAGGCGRYVNRGFTYCLKCEWLIRHGRSLPHQDRVRRYMEHARLDDGHLEDEHWTEDGP
jgi:hypothetical protein